MKTDMEAMKDQMVAMLSMRKIMEGNAVAVATTSAATEIDPSHPSSMNQVNRPASNMVGQGGKVLGSIGAPHFAQVQSKHPFPPYGLPPNYAPPNVVHVPKENVDHSAPIPFESQQPQSEHARVAQPMGESHEVPQDHALADLEAYLGYATKG